MGEREGEREGGREGGRERGRERERERGRERRKEGEKETEGGREGEREGGEEKGYKEPYSDGYTHTDFCWVTSESCCLVSLRASSTPACMQGQTMQRTHLKLAAQHTTSKTRSYVANPTLVSVLINNAWMHGGLTMYTVHVQTSEAHCVTMATKKSCDKLQTHTCTCTCTNKCGRSVCYHTNQVVM